MIKKLYTGTLIPVNALKALTEVLSSDSQRSYNTQHGMSAQEQALAANSLFGSPTKYPKINKPDSFSMGLSAPLSTPGQLHRISSASAHLATTPSQFMPGSISRLPSQPPITPKPMVICKPPSPVEPTTGGEYLNMPSFL